MKIVNKLKTLVIKYFYDLFHFGFMIAHCNLWGEFADFNLIRGKLKQKVHDKRKRLIYKFLTKKYADFIKEYKSKDVKIGTNSKTIWCLWWQGIEKAPLIIQKCIESLKNNSGDYKVVIINSDNYSKYVNIPNNIMKKVEKGKISFVHFSDILRMALLSKHGGVWVDSTMYFYDNVFNSFDNVEFNSGKIHSDKKKEWLGFFIGGKPNKLFSFCYDFFIKYNSEYNKLINYFLIDYAIEIAYENFDDCHEYINNISNYNPNLFLLQSILNDKYDESKLNNVLYENKFFKLSYKYPLREKTSDGKLTNYGYIISK